MTYSEVVERIAVLKRRAGWSTIASSIAGGIAVVALVTCAGIWGWAASAVPMDAVEVQIPASVQGLLSRTGETGHVSINGPAGIGGAIESAVVPLAALGSLLATMTALLSIGAAVIKSDVRPLAGLTFAMILYAVSAALAANSPPDSDHRVRAAVVEKAIDKRDVERLHQALVEGQGIPAPEMTFLEAQVAVLAAKPGDFNVAAALEVVQTNADSLRPAGAALYLLETRAWGSTRSAAAKAFEQAFAERMASWRSRAQLGMAFGALVATAALCLGAVAVGIRRRLGRIAALGVQA